MRTLFIQTIDLKNKYAAQPRGAQVGLNGEKKHLGKQHN